MSLQLRALLRGFHLRFSRKKIRRVGGVVGIHALLLLFRAYKNPYKRKCPKHLSSLCGRDSNTSSALPLIFIFFPILFLSHTPLYPFSLPLSPFLLQSQTQIFSPCQFWRLSFPANSQGEREMGNAPNRDVTMLIGRQVTHAVCRQRSATLPFRA